MNRSYCCLLVLSLLMLYTGILWADGEGVTDDDETQEQQFLFFMDEAYTQESQELQVSLLSYFQDGQSKEGQSEEYSQWVGASEIEYGLTDWLQVEFEIPYLHREVDDNGNVQSETGWGDSEAGLVALLHREGEAWWDATLSMNMEVKVPSGNYRKSLGSDKTGWGVGVAASKVLHDYVVHLGAGMEWIRDAKEVEIGGDPDDPETRNVEEFTCGAALVHRSTEVLESILELTAEFETEEEDDGTQHETEVYLTPGVRYGLGDDVEVGVGVPIGLTDDAYDWGVFVKLIFEH